jgi:hypothetical protein
MELYNTRLVGDFSSGLALLGGLTSNYFKRKQHLPKQTYFIVKSFVGINNEDIITHTTIKRNGCDELQKLFVGNKIFLKDLVLLNNTNFHHMSIISEDQSVHMDIKVNSEFSFSKLGKTAKIIEIIDIKNLFFTSIILNKYILQTITSNRTELRVVCDSMGQIVCLNDSEDFMFYYIAKFICMRFKTCLPQLINCLISILYCGLKNNSNDYCVNNKECECNSCCKLCCKKQCCDKFKKCETCGLCKSKTCEIHCKCSQKKMCCDKCSYKCFTPHKLKCSEKCSIECLKTTK